MRNLGALLHQQGEVSGAERWRRAAEAGHSGALTDLAGLGEAKEREMEAER